ncbi:MAG: NAD/NADP octopine/nopaline dehydrogenase family protein [Bacteroidaceae bacterium]|nr:NAD/NADP octopine/nopaline dehydrogenase family protein [Bacteroidaceae bacterium]
MKKKTEICICGGGNLAHVTGGYLASKDEYSVRLLTRHPEKWCVDGRPLIVEDPDGNRFRGNFSLVTPDAQTALDGAEIVLLCVPGFAIADELKKIREYVTSDMYIGSIVSSTGFFLMADELLGLDTRLFGLQRVPFIARVDEYGSKAMLLGYKPSITIATLHISEREYLVSTLTAMFDVPVVLLDNYMKVTLSNSNPILHPSRLYGMFGSCRETYDSEIMFYEDWDVRSSEILIECDREFRKVAESYDVGENDIPSLLTYYESSDAVSLTKKIHSISAFKGLRAPMIRLESQKYVPDYENRYFTEDIPFGMLMVRAFAERQGITTEMIDTVISWAQNVMNREYLRDGILNGCDLVDTIVPYVL